MSEELTIGVQADDDGVAIVGGVRRCIDMSIGQAHQVLRDLDAELHPWGEPGVVPTEPGDVFATDGVNVYAAVIAPNMDDPDVLELYDDSDGDKQWWHGYPVSDLLGCVVPLIRVRMRWTPEPLR